MVKVALSNTIASDSAHVKSNLPTYPVQFRRTELISITQTAVYLANNAENVSLSE